MTATPFNPQSQNAAPATSVVVVGSGFAGFECARRLVQRLHRARASDVKVTIVSPIDHMLYTPLLADVAGGLVDPRLFELRIVVAVEIVDADHRTPLLAQAARDMEADEAGRAGDQDRIGGRHE